MRPEKGKTGKKNQHLKILALSTRTTQPKKNLPLKTRKKTSFEIANHWSNCLTDRNTESDRQQSSVSPLKNFAKALDEYCFYQPSCEGVSVMFLSLIISKYSVFWTRSG